MQRVTTQAGVEAQSVREQLMLRAGAGTHTEHCSGVSRRLWQLMLRAEAGTHTLSTVVDSVEDCGFKIHNIVDACACLKNWGHTNWLFSRTF